MEEIEWKFVVVPIDLIFFFLVCLSLFFYSIYIYFLFLIFSMLCPSHTFISPHLPLPLVSWIRWMQTYIFVDFISLEKQSPRYYHCHVLGSKFYTQKLEKKEEKKLRIFSRVFIYGFHSLSPSLFLFPPHTHINIYIYLWWF